MIATIVAFLEEIGIPARAGRVGGEAFLPGLAIREGTIVYDPEALLYPGDLLHEAAHVAWTPAARRATLRDTLTNDPGDEMAAIAWTWAAALHLGLDPAVVFHEHGYRGGSAALVENFRRGRYVGVPLLQWAGMTSDYPRMDRWLRD